MTDDMTREEAVAAGVESMRDATELVNKIATLTRENIDRLRGEGKDEVSIYVTLALEFFKDDEGEPWPHEDLVGTLTAAIFKIINLQDTIDALLDGQHRGRS